MAINLKRRRAPVSYREPSSDVDSTGDSDQAHRKKRATPQRRSPRKRPTSPLQQNTDTARSDSEDKVRTVQLRERRKVTYQESSDDEESESEFEADEGASLPVWQRERPQPPRSRKEKKAGHTRLRVGAPLQTKPSKLDSRHAGKPGKGISSDGNIPNWSMLPYHVLLQVFVYASHPLYTDDLTRTPSISWLARVARLCTTFVKPALTALYRNPPIFAMRQTRKTLVQHLISPPPNPFADYSVMVKRLELDATKMSRLTDPSNSTSDLVALVLSLCNLREIDIFDPFDQPPYRERGKTMRRWHYPSELFDALGHSGTRLRSWRWNSSFCAQGPLWMKEMHSSTALQSLREVTLTKFHAQIAPDAEGGEPTTEELLGSALKVLPNLKSVTFETCTVVNGRLLPLLPDDLVHLNVTNCKDITSEALQAFLVTHGNHLEELTLNHNQSLDLSFLVNLKQYCPRLEVLKIDLNYYSTVSTSSDNEPLYDNLLEEGEIPSWPSTLRTIDIEFLRNWSASVAVTFFASLIDAAEELPWLREIIITAMVDIGWRQRAEFRKKWTDRFQKVYGRRWIPPDPTLVSMRAFREWKDTQGGATVGSLDSATAGLPGENESDSDEPLMQSRNRKETRKWNTKRLRCRTKTSNAYRETSSDNEADGNESTDFEDDKDNETCKADFMQGKCHTVVFKIDNSRPQEQIYGEEDFLDEESSGDEDWTGDDVVDEGYAW